MNDSLSSEGLAAAEGVLRNVFADFPGLPDMAAVTRCVVRAYLDALFQRPTTPDGGWLPLPGEEVQRGGSGELGVVVAMYTDRTMVLVDWFDGQKPALVVSLLPARSPGEGS